VSALHAAEEEPTGEEKARDARLEASAGRADLVDLEDDSSTVANVCVYLGVSREMVFGITKRYGHELRSVGYIPGTGSQRSAFTRRSVLHVAMLLPAKVGGRPRELREKLGVWTDKKPAIHDMSHMGSCRAAIEKAIETIDNVREIDPADVWTDLNRLDRWQLQAIVITLAAMIPDNLTVRRLTAYLLDISSMHREGDPNPAHGLLKLTPPRAERKKPHGRK
jgi:hypothetical protein